VADYFKLENRFTMLDKIDPAAANELLARAQNDVNTRRGLYEYLAARKNQPTHQVMNLTTTYWDINCGRRSSLRLHRFRSISTTSSDSKTPAPPAIVFHSLFEEQLRQDRQELNYNLMQGTESFAEALNYFPEPPQFKVGPEAYIEHIAKAKAATSIPIIGSLNGSTFGGWQTYARQIEKPGPTRSSSTFTRSRPIPIFRAKRSRRVT
jgi:hypothetical protein